MKFTYVYNRIIVVLSSGLNTFTLHVIITIIGACDYCLYPVLRCSVVAMDYIEHNKCANTLPTMMR